MDDSPRNRRLRSDLASMERLRDESSVLKFRADGRTTQRYLVEFLGKSLARGRGQVVITERHQVEIKLGASYPRTMPEIRWLTPIYHPNISEIGMVCLGGYGTHWVPSLNLEELVGMLWDMARYHNYDVRSPYNRDAALWVASQTIYTFPVDHRPIRDLRAPLGRVEPAPPPAPAAPRPMPFQAMLDAYKRGTRRGQTPAGQGYLDADALAPDSAAESHDGGPPVELEPVATPDPEVGHVRAAGPSDEGGLIFLDEPPSIPPAVPETTVRLRAQDEEIVFFD